MGHQCHQFGKHLRPFDHARPSFYPIHDFLSHVAQNTNLLEGPHGPAGPGPGLAPLLPGLTHYSPHPTLSVLPSTNMKGISSKPTPVLSPDKVFTSFKTQFKIVPIFVYLLL